MAGELTTNPFGSSDKHEGSALAVVEQSRAVAEIQASYVVAKKFPRDERKAMDRILQACTRTSLAEVAAYQYARGGQNITGPSIRMAEAIAQAWGNIKPGWQEVSRGTGADGVPYSEVRAYAIDLESNSHAERIFVVKHWRDTKQGGYALKDERDIYELCANVAARRLRACILQLIPGDVVDAAMEQVGVTLTADLQITAETIASTVKAFSEFGVTKAMLEKRIQRNLDTMTPALFLQLRNIRNSLRDGMSAPGDWFDVPQADGAAGAPAATPAPPRKSQHAAKTDAPAPAPAAAATSTPPPASHAEAGTPGPAPAPAAAPPPAAPAANAGDEDFGAPV